MQREPSDNAASGRHLPDDPSVPGTGGAPASSREGRQGLRLHERIAVIATVLSAFVAVVFFVVLGSIPLGVIFAVIALVCAGIAFWARRLRMRAAPAGARGGPPGGEPGREPSI